jgi:hypothetical protein
VSPEHAADRHKSGQAHEEIAHAAGCSADKGQLDHTGYDWFGEHDDPARQSTARRVQSFRVKRASVEGQLISG